MQQEEAGGSKGRQARNVAVADTGCSKPVRDMMKSSTQ